MGPPELGDGWWKRKAETEKEKGEAERRGRSNGFERRVKDRENRRKDGDGKRKAERKCGIKSLKKVGGKQCEAAKGTEKRN